MTQLGTGALFFCFFECFTYCSWHWDLLAFVGTSQDCADLTSFCTGKHRRRNSTERARLSDRSWHRAGFIDCRYPSPGRWHTAGGVVHRRTGCQKSDVLAKIDLRLFQAALDQGTAKKAQDAALKVTPGKLLPLPD